MRKILPTIIFAIFMLSATILIADYGDDLKRWEEQRLQEESNRNQPLQPSGTSPGPSYDPSYNSFYTTERLSFPSSIDSNDKPDNASQTNESKK